jgi:hypothetical protein
VNNDSDVISKVYALVIHTLRSRALPEKLIKSHGLASILRNLTVY